MDTVDGKKGVSARPSNPPLRSLFSLEPGTTIHVLHIEDNEGDVRLIREILKDFQAAVFKFRSAERLSAGLEILKGSGIDVVLLDLGLPDSKGIATLHEIRTCSSTVPVIVVTGLADGEAAGEAIRQGAQDYIVKGHFDSHRLGHTILNAIMRCRLMGQLERFSRELRLSENRFQDIIQSSADGILIVDEGGKVRFVNPAAEKLMGRPADRIVGTALGFDLGEETTSEIEIAREAGAGVFAEVRSRPIDWKGGRARVATLRDITDRKRAEDERRTSHERLKEAMMGTINAMARMVESRDPYTAGHQRRVARLAAAMAGAMGFPAERVDGVYMAGLIHDIGKIQVPAEILTKPGRLTKTEFDIIKTHCQVGFDIIHDIRFQWPIAQVVVQHHERVDGSGYPAGLSGEAVIPEARIIAVADVVEAMASHRPYREALGMDAALEEITKKKGALFDADAVEACVELVRDGLKLEPGS